MPRPAGRRLLILSIAAIALATLVPGGGDDSTVTDFCVLCGERGLADFLSNILLFAPFGFALGRRGGSLWRAAAVSAAASLGIELAQLSLISGRDANIGDVIANSLGGIVGWRLGHSRHWWVDGRGAFRRCLTVVGATLALLIAGLALLSPALPDSTYYVQWTARFRGMAAYEGRVISARLGPLDLPQASRMERSDSVRRMLFTQPLDLVATAAVPRSMAPILGIADDRQRQIMQLAADRADLVYRYRVLADVLRLDRGDLRVHQAFEHVPAGSTFHLVWTVDRKGYCLDLEGRRECGRGFTVGDTWTLLMALDRGTDERTVLRAMWLWLLFVPAGLLARRLRTLAAAALAVALTLTAAPLLLGFAATPLYQVIATCAGLVTGGALAARSRVRHTALSSGTGELRDQLHV